MLKLDIKDKELLKYLDAYCYIMNINVNDYIINAIESKLQKDLEICKQYAKGNYNG